MLKFIFSISFLFITSLVMAQDLILEPMSFEEIQEKSLEWLKKNNPDKLKDGKLIWQNSPDILSNLAETFAIGDKDAFNLLLATNKLPHLVNVLETIKDKDKFFKNNFGLIIAQKLSNNRVYEESLEILNGIKVEQVFDPNIYLFHKGVAEHALLKKSEAIATLSRLNKQPICQERYKHGNTNVSGFRSLG